MINTCFILAGFTIIFFRTRSSAVRRTSDVSMKASADSFMINDKAMSLLATVLMQDARIQTLIGDTSSGLGTMRVLFTFMAASVGITIFESRFTGANT